MSEAKGPLYLGFDLSTQQLKGKSSPRLSIRATQLTNHLIAIVVDSDLKVISEAKVDFDGDFGSKYGINKGVHVKSSTGEVYAPVALWMESLDLVLSRLAAAMPVPMDRIRGVSGSGQQHGSVFWSNKAEQLLRGLNPEKSLVEQLKESLAHEWSPNWQDQSTQKECDAFDEALGSRERLAEVTGSGAHHVRAIEASHSYSRDKTANMFELALHRHTNHATQEGRARNVRQNISYLSRLILACFRSPGQDRPYRCRRCVRHEPLGHSQPEV